MTDPLQSLTQADADLRSAYWDQKDLPRVVELGQEAIRAGKADAAATEDAALRQGLLALVKTVAYNLASFTWPGWGEPGIHPTAEQQAAGLNAAKLNLTLARELDRPPERLRDGHWLIAAQLMAADRIDEARSHLLAGKELAPSLLIDGYLALCDVLQEGEGAEPRWAQAMAAFHAAGGKGNQYFAEQLQTARQVFEQRAS